MPINSDYDLYSSELDDRSVSSLTAQQSRGDIVRENSNRKQSIYIALNDGVYGKVNS